MATCSGIKLNRNAQGFATAAGAGQVGACGTKPLRYAADVASGTTQSVDNLIVRNRLMTNMQLGGTLTLQGTGLPDPMFEAALCVKAGANIQGLSQHGLLRVIGDSYMGGPVAMTQCYGPLKVSNPPDSMPVAEVLTVDGGASSITFKALTVQSEQIDSGLLYSDDVLVKNQFKVDGYYGGPLATAQLSKLTSTWNVTVKAVVSGTTYTVLGVAVSHTTILLPYVLDASTDITLDDAGLTALSVVVQLTTGAFRALTVTMLRKMPTGNAALVKIDDAQGFLFDTFAELAPYDDDADTPEPGSEVLVVTGDQSFMGGTRSAVAGNVTEPSGQMFYQYTSIHVVLPSLQAQATGAALPNGSVGGAVYDYRGRLLAMLQYGTTNSIPSGGGLGAAVFQTIVGGIKARYLSLLTDPLLPLTTTVSFPDTASLAVRGIGTLERGVGLKTGGLTSAAVGASATLTDQLITYTSTSVSTVFLGSKGANTPSFQDSVLRSYRNGNTSATVVSAALSTSTTYTDAAVFTPAYWNKGPPVVFPPPAVASAFCTSANKSTDFIKAKTGTITKVSFNAGPFPGTPQAQAVAMTHGYQTDTTDVTNFIVAWGNPALLNTWFLGLGGYIAASWASAYLTVPTGSNVLAVAGFEDNTWTTFFYVGAGNSNLFTPNTTYNVTYDSANTVSINVTNSSSDKTYTLRAGSSYNWFAYTGIQTNCGWPLLIAGAKVMWIDGTPQNVTIAATTTAPTALY